MNLFNALGKFEPFQKPTIERAVEELAQREGYLIAYAMGLGKTPVAIEVARQIKATNILIVCPAMAREVWLHGNGPDFKDNGFARWWPERYKRATLRGREYVREPFSIRDTGDGPHGLSRWVAHANQAAEFGDGTGHVVVISYGMLRGLLDAVESQGVLFAPELIILDEAHYISNRKSGFARECVRATALWPEAKRLALTGTPLANPATVEGLWSILDWLYPSRFGELGAFRWRYMNATEAYDNKDSFRGFKYNGLNEAYKEELRLRLSECSSRLTKRDVAHLLPPFSASLVPFDGNRRVRAGEFAVSLLRQGHDHIRVACFLHETREALVHEIHKQLAKEKLDAAVTSVGGHQTPEARGVALAAQRTSPRSITVATIDSTKVAIDLTFQSASVYAELTHKIEAVIQNLGRGHRASSARGHDVFILADEAGDELATALCRKANTLAEIIGAGTEEKALQDTLGVLKAKGVSQAEIDELLASLTLGEEF